MADQRMQQFWQRLAGDADERFPDGMDVRVLRQDALTKRWTLYIQNSRTGPKKPTQYKRATLNNKDPRDEPGHVATCPFCKGMEALKTPNELCRVWPSGALEMTGGKLPADEEQWPVWSVRAVRNIFPYLAQPTDLYDVPAHAGPPAVRGQTNNSWTHPDPSDPLYPQEDAFGASEVIIESPQHNSQLAVATAAQVEHSLRALAARGRVLRDHRHAKQVAFFKQYGLQAGGSLVHPHMQVHSLPIVSGYMRGVLRNHADFHARFGCCAVERLYVNDVLAPGHGASTRLVRETRHFVASVPYAKHTKGRVVIAPKWHVQRFEDALGRGAGRPRRAAPAGHGRRLRAGERASRRGAQTLN